LGVDDPNTTPMRQEVKTEQVPHGITMARQGVTAGM